jgi:hypothetical protein
MAITNFSQDHFSNSRLLVLISVNALVRTADTTLWAKNTGLLTWRVLVARSTGMSSSLEQSSLIPSPSENGSQGETNARTIRLVHKRTKGCNFSFFFSLRSAHSSLFSSFLGLLSFAGNTKSRSCCFALFSSWHWLPIGAKPSPSLTVVLI